MTKLQYSCMAALGAALLLTSCSSDEPINRVDGEGVQITLRLPDAMMTRASQQFGDGLDAVDLTYAVYNSNGTLVTTETKQDFFDGTKLSNTLPLDLLNGEKYTILFWADSFGGGEDTPFTFSTDDKTITVDYTKIQPNSEAYDAFYACDTLTVKGPVTKTVTLNRPFAQINFGTNDLNKAAVTKEFGENLANLQTTFTVSGLANTLNLETGAVSGTADYTATVGVPTGQPFPQITVDGEVITGINYLQMDYVLAGKATNDIAQFNLQITNSASKKVFNTISVPNAPYRANYRTNIFGQLLTTTNNFQIVIDPIFETPDYNPMVWDGTTKVTPQIVTDPDGTKHVDLNSPAELAGLPDLAADNDLSEVVINIGQSMDMNGNAMTQLGNNSNFSGKIEGNGNTISNLPKPLIYSAGDLTINNLNFDVPDVYQAGIMTQSAGDVVLNNVTVTGNVKGLFTGAGGFINIAQSGTVTLNNCTNYANVSDGTYAAGGFIARTMANVPTVMKNCVNHGDVICTRSSGAKAGGIIGMPAAPVELTDCSNTGNVTITTNGAGCAVGGIVGWFGDTLKLNGCSSTSGKITVNYNGSSSKSIILAGGLYGGSGWGNNTKEFTNCTNGSDIIVNAPNMSANDNAYNHGIYAGGIVGGTSYDSSFVMSGCTSRGKISVNQGQYKLAAYVGGLVGAIGWENDVTFSDNTIESSCVLTGGTYTAAVLCNMGGMTKTPTLTGNINHTSYAATAGF